jgi:hypothetical protein
MTTTSGKDAATVLYVFMLWYLLYRMDKVALKTLKRDELSEWGNIATIHLYLSAKLNRAVLQYKTHDNAYMIHTTSILPRKRSISWHSVLIVSQNEVSTLRLLPFQLLCVVDYVWSLTEDILNIFNKNGLTAFAAIVISVGYCSFLLLMSYKEGTQIEGKCVSVLFGGTLR